MRWPIVLLVAACGDNQLAPDAAPDSRPQPVFAQTAYIKSTHPFHDAHFGESGLSASGDTLVVGQRETVTVYARDPSWRVEAELEPPSTNAGFGDRVAISSDGSTIAVGAPEQTVTTRSVLGAVYVFRKVGTSWMQEARIDDVNDTGAAFVQDEFPRSLALSHDGNTLVVASRNSATDSVRLRTYDRRDNAWSLTDSMGGGLDDEHPGLSFSLSPDGDGLATFGWRQGDPDSSVDIFVRAGDTWAHRATLTSPDPISPASGFGESISCALHCDVVAVGAVEPGGAPGPPPIRGPGSAFVFARKGDTWASIATLRAHNGDVGDVFGTAVALSSDGTTVVVGAPAEHSAGTGIDADGANNDAPFSGAAYVFRRYGAAFAPVAFVKASNAEAVDNFGRIVKISDDGTTFVIAAPFETGGASGIDGDQADDSVPYAGAMYAFKGTY